MIEMEFFHLVLVEVALELDWWDREWGIYEDSRLKARDAFLIAKQVIQELKEDDWRGDKYYIDVAQRNVKKHCEKLLGKGGEADE